MIGLLTLILMAASPTGSPEARSWERLFEVHGGREMWISSIRAVSRDAWYAGGRWGVAWNTKDGIQQQAMPGKAVIGMFQEDSGAIFALGTEELVLRFDGNKWAEEHVGPTPKRRGRGADLVYVGFHWEMGAHSKLVAVGPSLVLVRQPDQTWKTPEDSEKQKLLELGMVGPPLSLPAGCAKVGWFWLGKNKGFFDCHDGRSFVFDKGTTTAKGKLPRDCSHAFDALTYGQGEVFASCGSGKLWKTDADGWHLFATLKGEKELTSISVTADCVFVAGRQKIWRTCSAPELK